MSLRNVWSALAAWLFVLMCVAIWWCAVEPVATHAVAYYLLALWSGFARQWAVRQQEDSDWPMVYIEYMLMKEQT